MTLPKAVGFKPEKGQSQWTRSCQNSGKNKRRRPQLYSNVTELLKDGFKKDKKTGLYQKTVKFTVNGKKHQSVISAIGLSDNEKTVFYSCFK